MPSIKASVEQSGSGKMPYITEGSLDLDCLSRFLKSARTVLDEKNVDDDKRVNSVLNCLNNNHKAHLWVNNNRAALVKLTWDEFRVQFYTRFLGVDWPEVISEKLLRARQTDFSSFDDFVDTISSWNLELTGTSHELVDTALILQARAGLNDELREEARTVVADSFADWVSSMAPIVAKTVREQKSLKRAAERLLEEQGRSKRSSYSNSRPNSRAQTPSVPNKQSGSYSSSSNASRNWRNFPPRITDEERKVFHENDGCTKCRRLQAGHRSDNCPVPEDQLPTRANYRTTFQQLEDLQRKEKKPSSGSSKGSGSTSRQNTTVAAVLDDTDRSVAVVLPADTSSSSDGDSVSIAPLRVPYIRWTCSFSACNSRTHIVVNSLIDCGSFLVLIHPNLVSRLELPVLSLLKPEQVSLALKDSESRLVTTVPTYSLINPSTLDNRWTSRTCKAVICPSLCCDLVLGLPFLSHNRIVVDVYSRTAVAMDSNVNILDPCNDLRTETSVKSDPQTLSLKAFHGICALFPDICPPLSDSRVDPIREVKTKIRSVAAADELLSLHTEFMKEYAHLFKPVPHTSALPSDVYCTIELVDPSKKMTCRTYTCPRKFREAWKTVIDQHLANGKIRPSCSSFASPSFVIPKSDPKALPRWVCDYRALNANSRTDCFPLPRVDDILADCANGKIWAKLDMTNAFGQTLVHPDSIPLTAVSTPFGLYEWVGMPQGLKNTPSIHQRRVTAALRPLIGKCCHIYLDDIIIWSMTLDEHIVNVKAVLDALVVAQLYCNPDKTSLFTTELFFLGHSISADGIKADESKIRRIVDWPVPKSVSDVQAFLGLVRYVANFLPNLADHTRVLHTLTTKEASKDFPPWKSSHQRAFEAIKGLVIGSDCLTTIDHVNPGKNKIFVTTDASDFCSGAVLAWGETWESAHPVAFDSMTFKGAELRYPTHEKELLAIVRALKKWRADLLGSSFQVFTDHGTLENFNSQKDLSARQARWMEYMSHYDCNIVYVKGEDNSVADALVRILSTSTPPMMISWHRYVWSPVVQTRLWPWSRLCCPLERMKSPLPSPLCSQYNPTLIY